MTTTVEIVIAVFACTGFWQFVQYLIDTHRTKRTATEEATVAILHELVYPKLEECILRGSVGLEEYDRIDYLVQPYLRLGGNGTVKRRFDMVTELPRIDDVKKGFEHEHRPKQSKQGNVD